MFKKNKGNGKFDGLSEQQRLQMRQLEAQQAESKKRFEDALPDFKRDYNLLVHKYGCIHSGKIEYDRFRGIWPDVAIVDCWRQVQAQERAQKEEATKAITDVND